MRTALVSTTKQWNPGDEFIWFGVRNLLEKVFGTKTNWLLWNRNPDMFINGWEQPFMSPHRWTNAVKMPSLELCDAVVLAGSPEWHGWPVEPIYRELLVYKDKPLICLGAGSGEAEVKLTPAEKEVLSRDSTLITTRSQELADSINSQLNMNKAKPLPCPAVFCNSKEFAIPNGNSSFGCILQDSTVVNQSIPEECVQTLLAGMKQKENLEAICFYYPEFARYARQVQKTHYSFESKDYLESILPSFRAIISTRLHGAIGSLSLGVPSALINFGSFRLKSTVALYKEILPYLSAQDAVDWIASLTESELNQRREKIHSFKKRVEAQYIEEIQSFAQRYVR
jgi:hypothetical protein